MSIAFVFLNFISSALLRNMGSNEWKSVSYMQTPPPIFTQFSIVIFFVQMSAVCDIPTLSPITNSPSLSTYRVSFNTIIHDEVFPYIAFSSTSNHDVWHSICLILTELNIVTFHNPPCTYMIPEM